MTTKTSDSDVFLYGYIVPQSLLMAIGQKVHWVPNDPNVRTAPSPAPPLAAPLTRLDTLAVTVRTLFMKANLYVPPPPTPVAIVEQQPLSVVLDEVVEDAATCENTGLNPLFCPSLAPHPKSKKSKRKSRTRRTHGQRTRTRSNNPVVNQPPALTGLPHPDLWKPQPDPCQLMSLIPVPIPSRKTFAYKLHFHLYTPYACLALVHTGAFDPEFGRREVDYIIAFARSPPSDTSDTRKPSSRKGQGQPVPTHENLVLDCSDTRPLESDWSALPVLPPDYSIVLRKPQKKRGSSAAQSVLRAISNTGSRKKDKEQEQVRGAVQRLAGLLQTASPPGWFRVAKGEVKRCSGVPVWCGRAGR